MAKTRISLTLDEDLVQTLDHHVQAEGIESRSQGVENILRQYLQRRGPRIAVILGGGEDSSCLVDFEGRPVIDHSLEFLEREGIRQIYIATADPAVRDHLEDNTLGGGILYEEQAMGTAGSLKQLDIDTGETFLVMNGDVLCEIDVEDMVQVHRDAEVLATMALTTSGETSEYGVVQMKGNRIVGFTEKPEQSESHLINAGVYLLEEAFLNRIPAGKSWLTDLFEQLAEERELAGYVYEGEWREFE